MPAMKIEEKVEDAPQIHKKNQDDVFIDEVEEGNYGYNQEEPALFDDLLDVGAN